MPAAAMLPHLSAASPMFLGLVAVLVIVLIALVKKLWGSPWWPPGK